MRFARDNALSLAFLALFLACIAGQGVTGWLSYSQTLGDLRFPPIGFAAFLGTGQFLDAMMSNWQAAILQLGVLITFSAVLRQKGAVHSRKDAPEKGGDDAAPADVASPGAGGWIYAHSLALAFLAMFLASFAAHAIFGSWKHDEDQILRHLPPGTFGGYLASAEFWFTVMQTWEAEFAVIGLYVVLSIFLRQAGSPESKPVQASDAQTGGPNE